jgi:uncharacterized delta-60 repeat protein
MSKLKTLLFIFITGLLLAACSQVAEVPQEETPQLESAATTPGSLDTTFNKSGKLFQGFSTSGGGLATHMVTLPNGKAIVAFELREGQLGASNFRQFIAVRRYNEDGSLDRTFGGPGNVQATIKGFTPSLTPQDLLVTPEGRIFIAARGFTSSSVRPFIFALTPSGILDSSFAGDGSLSPVTTIANPSTNKIFAADLAYDSTTKKLTLGGTIRPNSGNSFLWTFAVDVNNTNFPKETTVKESGANLEMAKLEKLSNGEFVMAAGITPASGGGIPRGYLVRQLDNGIIVRKAINVVGFETFIQGLKVDGNKIFLAGSAFTSGFNTQGYVARFDLETLTKDTAFGSNGIRLVGNEVRDIAFSQGTGTAKKILVAGTDGTDYLVARMSYNGQIDNAFGKNGLALVSFSGFVDERALAISVDSKNRIWAAGLTEPFNDGGFRAGLFRLLP